MMMVAQFAGDPATLAAPLRDVVRGLDVNMPLFNVRTMEQLYRMRAISIFNVLVTMVGAMGLMGLALLYMVFRPAPIKHSEDEPPLDRETLTKISICVALLLVFAGLFEPLGFILSSILIGIPMARLYGGRWVPSVIVTTLMAIGLYVLFDRVMDVPLPLGLLDVLEN